MRWRSTILVLSVFTACGGTTTPGSTTSPVGVADGGADDDGCPESACAGQVAPPFECVGGVRSPVCAPRSDGHCALRIDCAPFDPNAPPDNRGVSSCQASACGPVPTYDEEACLHGFVPAPPQCESLDLAPCAWSRRCRPKPCSGAECNRVDEGRLGDACSLDARCPNDSSCVTFAVDFGVTIGPVCVAGNPCEAMTCGTGTTCSILESEPAQVVCSPR